MDFKAKVSTDSRSIGPGDVFFALKGERFDGHDFVGAAVEKGASAVVYSDPGKLPRPLANQVKWIQVSDVLRAYGDWAAEYRRRMTAKVIAITGSSGKTSVKEMLAHVLGSKYKIHKTQGTENNQVGVPKTIFGIRPDVEWAVLELGTSWTGEIERLSEIASPDMVVVTRIGPSHLQGLGSLEGVRKEKLSIVRGLRPGGLVWLNADDALLASASLPGFAVRRCGMDESAAEVRAEAVRTTESGMEFRAGQTLFKLSVIGRHNVSNALLVIGIARVCGMDDESIAAALRDYRPVNGRLEIRKIDAALFLNDSYNANPVSFEAALRALAEYPGRGRRAVVAGDMLELGEESGHWHGRLGRQIAEGSIDLFIAVGERMKVAASEAAISGLPKASIWECRDAREAGAVLRTWLRPEDLVLVKGSRGMKMETLFECFTPSFTR